MRRSNARALSSPPESGSDKMDSEMLATRTPSRSNISLRNSKRSRRLNILILTSLVTTSAILLFLFAVTRVCGPSSGRRFGVVIDGGSTGSRIHVFEYAPGNGIPLFNLKSNAVHSMRVNPGLSSYAEDPDSSGNSLTELLQFARERIPGHLHKETDTRLMATAGLRLLKHSVQERILNSCRTVLRSSGFKFLDSWASVISGSDEGVYAWVVANYALGTLGGDPKRTTGIVELGGASAQITFIPDGPFPREYLRPLAFGNATYKLYSHSLLRFGQNAAFESLGDPRFPSPCTPRGYFGNFTQQSSAASPWGNFSGCRAAALRMLRGGEGRCGHVKCNVGSTFVPELRGDFLLTENFFHTSTFLGVAVGGSLRELADAGDEFCGEEWAELRRKYGGDEEELLQYCFSSAYIVALLHDSLGLDLDDSRIRFVNRVRGVPLDWAFGAFILHAALDPDPNPPNWILATLANGDPPPVRSLSFVIAGVLVTAWLAVRWRKPHLKTIYDLEKGRYIITRVRKM